MPQVQVIQPIQQQPKRLRVAAYARVSSDSEDQLNSLSVQVDYYTHLIQENPNWDFAGIYADEGITGTSTKHREQFNRLLDDCRAGLIDRVLVKSASRFARNTADALASVREMKSLGVTVVFEKEGFDTETSNGEMILSMICATAQEESLSISKNLKWGIRKRMQDGTYLNGMSPFGYEKQESQLIPIEREAEIVRYIYSSFLVGVGTVQIAEELNRRYPKENGTWYVSAVRRILMNEKYIGDVHHQKNFTPDDLPLLCQKNSGQLPQYYVQNHHKALVSRQEFEKVQTLLKRKGTERKNQNTCAFSNKLYCAECGSVFSRKVRANGVVAWGCRKHLDKSELCPVKPVYEADLCRVFLSMYNKLQANRDKVLRPAMDDLASLRYLQEQRNSERVTITEEIQRLGKQNHNLERLRTTGCIDSAQYWERRAVIEQQLIEKKALLMRRFFNKNVEKVLRQTKGISTRLPAGPPLTDFDEAAFTALVSRVKISSTAITFGLINGMNLPEGRTEP